ncbi:MAG TPA: acyl-CoA thioesterase [Synechococcales cyanobacterium M55_K2018_004]|nr:acyl-CoA thioesterase [Synechococcales cyanobacterium M55_K2018_004]
MQPQLESTHAIETSLRATHEPWFHHVVRLYPHQTDYSGIAWHGTYIAWMEEARVEYLRSLGVNYSDLVNLGYEMPVVELNIRYHRSVQMGAEAIVKTRLSSLQGVRMNWEYRIESADEQELYVTAQVTLVTVDLDKKKIVRQLPAQVQDVLQRLRGQ